MENEETAVAFVTKKALITLNARVCILVNGTPMETAAFIVEYSDAELNGPAKVKVPNEVTVIGFPDGRRLRERIFLHLRYDLITCAMELPADWEPL